MFWSRKRNAELDRRVAELEIELRKLQSAFRQLEGEQLTVHDQVHKWMRRGLAARNQGPSVPATPAPAPAAVMPAAMGARARILARRAARAQQMEAAELNGGDDGSDA
jgi:hypothetical protein